MKYFSAYFALLLAAGALSANRAAAVDWKRIEPGFEFAKYELGEVPAVIRPEVYLLKFDPKFYSFLPVAAEATGEDKPPAADVRTLTRKVGGVAGINANFFDEKGEPLGLLIVDSTQAHKLHRGGRVLTGIFAIRSSGEPLIAHRDSFRADGVAMAIQAGPRLVENGKPVDVSAEDDSSRRSGIAITKNNQVILYATVLRFPGATLANIQTMLLDPTLGVDQALNLDGGGSSQLFIESFATLAGETFISGGDPVPVGIVVKRKAAP